jgi:hypothetical protein
MVFKEKNKYKSSEFFFIFSSLSLTHWSIAVYASLLLVDFSSVHITAGFRNNFQDQKRLAVYILRVKIAAAFEEELQKKANSLTLIFKPTSFINF